jgi:hypothetical protein
MGGGGGGVSIYYMPLGLEYMLCLTAMFPTVRTWL